MASSKAIWSISLSVICPACSYKAELDYSELDIYPGETGTSDTKDIDVLCQKCGHEFLVDFIQGDSNAKSAGQPTSTFVGYTSVLGPG